MRREGERICHVDSFHDLVRPLAVYIIQLVDLDPSSNASSLCCICHWAVEEVRDGTRVSGGIPLHLDRIACFGSVDGFGARDDIAINVAGNIIRLNICLWT